MGSGKGKQKPRGAEPALARLINWRHGLSFLLGAALAAGVMLGLPAKSSNLNHPAVTNSIIVSASTGPWGQIEYTAIELERPDESFPADDAPAPTTLWFFDDLNENEIVRLFEHDDLSEEQTRQLTDRSGWMPNGDGWAVRPSPDLVENLSSAARRRIYVVLGRNPKNWSHCSPFHVAADRFEEWVRKSGLSPERQAFLRKVSYADNDSVYVCDWPLLESKCTLDEKKQLAKKVSRIPALIMRLRITSDSDVDALSQYWGRCGRMRAMKPFLESLARTPGGGSVPVSYFFPEFARMRLYTFPDPKTDRNALQENCLWTAMNFQTEHPDNRFFDLKVIRQAIQTEYTQVTSNWTFGDVVVLLESGSSVKHMCVYVADNVVFTKNGYDPLVPWVLVKIPDMVKLYEGGKPLQLVAYRRKGT